MKTLKVFATFLLILSAPFQILGFLCAFVWGSIKAGADSWDQLMHWASDRV